MTQENKLDLTKRAAFAAFLVRTKGDSMQAGELTFPDNPLHAMMAAVEWNPSMDPVVQQEVERLKREGSDLPTKVDLQRQLWERMELLYGDDYLKAAKLLAELSGYIEKPAAVQVNQQNKVVIPKMINAPNFSMEEWQKQAEKQQKASLENADSFKQ